MSHTAHTPQSAAASHETHADHESVAHPLPMSILLGVFAALLVLTFVTVAVTWVDLGPLNIWIAMVIAAVKAGLVGLYFMHLRYDAPFNGFILLIAMLFVAIFIATAITDTGAYRDVFEPPAFLQPQ